MRSVLVAVIVTAFTASMPGLAPAEEPAKGLAGKWEFTSQQYNGAPGVVTAEESKGDSMTFTKDKMFLVLNGKKVNYRYTVDEKAKPKQIDLVALDGPFESKTFEAIYEVDGDTLKFAVGGFPRVKRPTEFVSKKGAEHWAFALKRVKE
jgi:uncharacterized protein (TIGR03067 family)